MANIIQNLNILHTHDECVDVHGLLAYYNIPEWFWNAYQMKHIRFTDSKVYYTVHFHGYIGKRYFLDIHDAMTAIKMMIDKYSNGVIRDDDKLLMFIKTHSVTEI